MSTLTAGTVSPLKNVVDSDACKNNVNTKLKINGMTFINDKKPYLKPSKGPEAKSEVRSNQRLKNAILSRKTQQKAASGRTMHFTDVILLTCLLWLQTLRNSDHAFKLT
jgi:hypothetical protein